jgi:hypothetical protein
MRSSEQSADHEHERGTHTTVGSMHRLTEIHRRLRDDGVMEDAVGKLLHEKVCWDGLARDSIAVPIVDIIITPCRRSITSGVI